MTAHGRVICRGDSVRSRSRAQDPGYRPSTGAVLADQDDGGRYEGGPLMTTPTSHRVLELRQQSRARRASADHLRTEQQLICEQTRRRLAESRLLLDRSVQRLTR